MAVQVQGTVEPVIKAIERGIPYALAVGVVLVFLLSFIRLSPTEKKASLLYLTYLTVGVATFFGLCWLIGALLA